MRLLNKDKICIDCGEKGVKERYRCDECAKAFNRKRAKDRYKKHGRHNYGKTLCPICKKEMTLWKKKQGSHTSCRPKTIKDYNKLKRTCTGNTFANQMFIDAGIKLPPKFVVHHLDENPENNDPKNLIGISNSIHTGLHKKLQYHRSLFLKENSTNNENCWNTLRDHLTTAYLETKGAKVLRINDIGQSAAELAH